MSAPYKDYRDTALEVLNQLPSSWRVRTVRHDVWVRARLGWKGLTADEYVDDGVPMLATPNITGAELDYASANRITQERFDESPEIALSDGDVLLTKDGSTIGTVNVVRSLPEPATVNGSIAVLTPRREIDGRFLYWFIASSYAQAIFDRLRGGMGVPHLFQRDINRIKYPAPPLADQRAIADYLDRETAKIDALIEEQQRLIELLRERRMAALDSAFLDSDQTIQLRVGHLLERRPAYGVLVPEYVDAPDAVPFVRVGDISKLDRDRPFPKIVRSQSEEYGRTQLAGGEIVLGVVGKMGQAAVVPGWLSGANVARAVAVLRCSNADVASLLCAWFATNHFFDQASLATSGDSVQPTLGMSDLAAFSLNWPRDEAAMSRLIEKLSVETTKIDELIAETERFIELSRERRAALITAAVTGQIDVRDRVGVGAA